jgi:hypothetical protein
MLGYREILLTAPVQSVIKRLLNSLCSTVRNPGSKGSLLKVREGKYKGEHGGVQVESGGRARTSFL